MRGGGLPNNIRPHAEVADLFRSLSISLHRPFSNGIMLDEMSESPGIDLSIVSPVYNEAQVLDAFCDRLITILEPLHLSCEVILIDDGSSDATPDIIARRCDFDPCFRAIHLARNFGQQAALTAGIEAARGSAVITMDADLQHPPEELPRMIEAWKQGNQLVTMERDATQRISLIKRAGTSLFYFFINRWSDISLGRNIPDFRLMDRTIVDRFKELPERNRFVRGLINWMGFKPQVLHFKAPAGPKDATGYSFRKMVHLAIDALTSFTAFPLRMALYSGFAISFLSAVYLFYAIYVALFLDSAVKGWASLISVVLFLGGCQMVFLGIIGEYLFRIFTEVKQRPLYIVKKTRNI
jgi:glycosyltransferase involved in cell wall biosynthesis